MAYDNQIERIYVSKIRDESGESAMKFKLYYDGPLGATQKRAKPRQKDKLSNHKHMIRQCFHRQIRELWTHDINLKNASVKISNKRGPLAGWVAMQHKMFGYNFAPLIRKDWGQLCSLDILLLRRDMSPRAVVWSGDLDNRVKTLIDGLTMPRSQNQLTGDNAAPNDDEAIFFSLLEDDDLISDLRVRSDCLLSGWSNSDLEKYPEMNQDNYVKAIIDVKIESLDSMAFLRPLLKAEAGLL